MRTVHGIPLMFAVSGLAALLVYAGSDWSSLRAQAGIALTGRVISDQDGSLEGVVVRPEGRVHHLDVGCDR